MLAIFGTLAQLSECQKQRDVVPYDEMSVMTSEMPRVRCRWGEWWPVPWRRVRGQARRDGYNADKQDGGQDHAGDYDSE